MRAIDAAGIAIRADLHLNPIKLRIIIGNYMFEKHRLFNKIGIVINEKNFSFLLERQSLNLR